MLYIFFTDANAIFFLFSSILNIVFLVAQQHVKSSSSKQDAQHIQQRKNKISIPSFVNGKKIKTQK